MKLAALPHPFLFILLSRKSQRPRLIMYLSKKGLQISKGFSFITVHDHFCSFLYSFYFSFSQKISKDFNIISSLTFASHFKNTYILQHEHHYVLPYIHLPKSRVKLQSDEVPTTFSEEHNPGQAQKLLLSTSGIPTCSIPPHPAGTTCRHQYQHFRSNFTRISSQLLIREAWKNVSCLFI